LYTYNRAVTYKAINIYASAWLVCS
jgi:hypothetical protein